MNRFCLFGRGATGGGARIRYWTGAWCRWSTAPSTTASRRRPARTSTPRKWAPRGWPRRCWPSTPRYADVGSRPNLPHSICREMVAQNKNWVCRRQSIPSIELEFFFRFLLFLLLFSFDFLDQLQGSFVQRIFPLEETLSRRQGATSVGAAGLLFVVPPPPPAAADRSNLPSTLVSIHFQQSIFRRNRLRFGPPWLSCHHRTFPLDGWNEILLDPLLDYCYQLSFIFHFFIVIIFTVFDLELVFNFQ